MTVALARMGETELAQFVASYEEVLRPQILSQCQEYLTFDDMLGHQEWSAEAAEEPQGRSFGDFLIQEELGRGGMGDVYLVRDTVIDRKAAAKAEDSPTQCSVSRTSRSAREPTRRQLSHGNRVVDRWTMLGGERATRIGLVPIGSGDNSSLGNGQALVSEVIVL